MEPFKIALTQYGNKEIAGLLHNAEVVKYFKEIGQTWVKDDETAWCAAFVNWCLKKAGLQHTGSLAARSFLSYGVSTKKPLPGDLVVLWRITKNSSYGHVGFFVREKDDIIYILGGNQGDQVNISMYSKTQLLDYRVIPELKHA